MKYSVLVFFIFISTVPVLAQPVEVESNLGNNKFGITSFIRGTFGPEDAYQFVNISIYEMYHTEDLEQFNGNVSHTYLYRNVTPSTAAGAALSYIDVLGYIPKGAFQYVLATDQLFISMEPALGYHEGDMMPELVLTSRYSIPVASDQAIQAEFQSVNLFRGQDFDHARSFQNFKLGYLYGNVDFGFSTKINHYGPNRDGAWNSGGYLRYQLF